MWCLYLMLLSLCTLYHVCLIHFLSVRVQLYTVSIKCLTLVSSVCYPQATPKEPLQKAKCFPWTNKEAEVSFSTNYHPSPPDAISNQQLPSLVSFWRRGELVDSWTNHLATAPLTGTLAMPWFFLWGLSCFTAGTTPSSFLPQFTTNQRIQRAAFLEGLWHFNVPSHFNVLNFVVQFYFHSKTEQKIGRVLLYPHSTHACSTINTSTTVVCLLKINGPIMTHYSKYMIYITLHSWCYAFNGLWQTHKDMYPPL